MPRWATTSRDRYVAIGMVACRRTLAAAARAARVGPDTVSRWCRSAGVPVPRPGRRRGSPNRMPRAKWLRQAIDLADQDLPLSLIAEKVGRAQSTVHEALRRWAPRRWGR